MFPTTTTTAGSVRWNSDGSPNGSGDSTGGPTTWTTSWPLGPAGGRRAPDRRPAVVHDAVHVEPPCSTAPTRSPPSRSTTAASPATRARRCSRSTAPSRSRSPGSRSAATSTTTRQARVPLERQPRERHRRLPGLRPRLGQHAQGNGGGKTRSSARPPACRSTTCTGTTLAGHQPDLRRRRPRPHDINDSCTALRELAVRAGVQASSTVPGAPPRPARPPGPGDAQAEADWSHPNTAARSATTASTATPAARPPTATTRPRTAHDDELRRHGSPRPACTATG